MTVSARTRLLVVVLATALATAGLAAAADRGIAQTAAPSRVRPVFLVYYLWWSANHWDDLLGRGYPKARRPSPLQVRGSAATQAAGRRCGWRRSRPATTPGCA